MATDLDNLVETRVDARARLLIQAALRGKLGRKPNGVIGRASLGPDGSAVPC